MRGRPLALGSVEFFFFFFFYSCFLLSFSTSRLPGFCKEGEGGGEDKIPRYSIICVYAVCMLGTAT